MQFPSEYINLAAKSGDQHSTDRSSFPKTNLVFVRLDAFIATAVASVGENGNGSVLERRKMF